VSIELASGALPPEEAWASVLLQVLWLAAAAGVARFAWRRGIRRYEAFGA